MPQAANILVIEDEEPMRDLLSAELADEGYDVATAASGEEGLALFDARRPDLVILDIKMAGIGGMKTLELLRERTLDVPVLLFTAYPEYKQDFNAWASDDYVVKSSDMAPLKEKIRFHLNARRTR